MDAKQMTKEEREQFMKDYEYLLDVFWQTHKEEMDKKLAEKDIIINSLIATINNKDIEVLELEDICSIFKWEEQKGRKFLKMAMQMKYAAKIGKQTVITKSDLERFLEFLKGKELTI